MFWAVACGVWLAAYFPLLHGRWQLILGWDDDGNFLMNDMVAGLGWSNVLSMFTGSFIGVYEPFSFLEKAVALATLSATALPYVLRLVAAGVHLVSCFLVYQCTRELLGLVVVMRVGSGGSSLGLAPVALAQAPAAAHFAAAGAVKDPVAGVGLASSGPLRTTGQDDGGVEMHGHQARVDVASAVGALVFMVHPIHCEVLGWPSANPYTLSLVFALLATRAYLGMLRTSVIAASTGGAVTVPAPGLVSGAAAAYVVAVLHKSMSLPLPVALVGVDVAVLWPLTLTAKAAASAAAPGRLGPAAALVDILWFSLRCLWAKRSLLAVGLALSLPTLLSNKFDAGYGSHQDTIMLTLSQRLVLACIRMWAGPVLAAAPVSLRPHYRILDGMLAFTPDAVNAWTAGVLQKVSPQVARVLGARVVADWHPRAEPVVATVGLVAAVVWVLGTCNRRPWLLGACMFYTIMYLPVSRGCSYGVKMHASWLFPHLRSRGLSRTSTSGVVASAIARPRICFRATPHPLPPAPVCHVSPPSGHQVMGLMQHGLWQLLADRYLYAPLLVLAPLVASAVHATLPKDVTLASPRRLACTTVGASAVLVAVLAFLSSRQISVWRTSETVFSHSLQCVPGSALPYHAVPYRPVPFRATRVCR
jgi:hypothetical protein